MQVSNLLMFTGDAEEAMAFYVTLFPQSRIVSIERYGANEAGEEGSVKQAIFELCATRYRCIDSPVKHAFTFTPSISLFVDFDSQEQLQAALTSLSDRGQILMPAGSYDFSKYFAWIQDRFGVSWQLNLQHSQISPAEFTATSVR
jgi:predicted 3-demethylubiquinone-9 3-methyltransferase (glyoxalase superfamily)